jgi:hypothetical protein
LGCLRLTRVSPPGRLFNKTCLWGRGLTGQLSPGVVSMPIRLSLASHLNRRVCRRSTNYRLPAHLTSNKPLWLLPSCRYFHLSPGIISRDEVCLQILIGQAGSYSALWFSTIFNPTIAHWSDENGRKDTDNFLVIVALC